MNFPELRSSRARTRTRYLPAVLFAAAYVGFFGINDVVDLFIVIAVAFALILLRANISRHAFSGGHSDLYSPLHATAGPLQADVDESPEVQSPRKTESSSKVADSSASSMSHLSRRRQADLGTMIRQSTSGNRCGFTGPRQLG
jgi:hypothetical protein